MRILYLTGWYADANPLRHQELLSCLQRVVNSPDVDEVHVLAESPIPFEHPKIKSYPVTGRSSYDEFFECAQNAGSTGDIAIVANTDIYPAVGLRAQLEGMSDHECYALSRWDELPSGSLKHFGRQDSQDVWVFKLPMKVTYGAFNIGVPGCDNRIAHEFKQAGYAVTNPSETIKFVHVHNSHVRNYNPEKDTVPKPYHFVGPSKLPTMRPTLVKRGLKKILHVGFPQPPLERAFADELMPKAGSHYHFINWMSYQGKAQELNQLILTQFEQEKYDLLFFHIQTANIISLDTIAKIRQISPETRIVNWTGDVRTPLPQWYITLGQAVDLTLFSNETDMQTARAAGIRADYLQIGFDQQIFKPGIHPKKEWPEIVFLGNNYPGMFPLSDLRENMVQALQSHYGKRFGLYGGGWKGKETGNLMGNEAEEVDCYHGCKIAINLSHFDYERYSSDRIFRIMGSSAFCLTKVYPGIQRDFILAGNSQTLDTWQSITDLIRRIDYWLANADERIKVAVHGARWVHDKHTWENRLVELKKLLNYE